MWTATLKHGGRVLLTANRQTKARAMMDLTGQLTRDPLALIGHTDYDVADTFTIEVSEDRE